ncbi:MAG: Glu-tRNA(Gln) amidotransferase subunit GatD, partial [Candidatus Diapherotrites archaeon]|nr:Glu-tRNA(Gln) amidotransferase subunit GatD [Candidatus Diapherotrites archaeon]
MAVASFLKKNNLVEGDVVELTKDGSLFVGTIIPSPDPSCVVLKLKSGYNAGFLPESVSAVRRLSKGTAVSKPPAKDLKPNSLLPTILILHTGGTIASRVDYRTGAVVASFDPADMITMFPKLAQIANFESHLVANMMSEDLRVGHYAFLAESIGKELKKNPALKGVIISHGTDTLAYTSAALAFAVSNCPVPVLLVGAQRSSDRGSSDAQDNLVAAATFIVKSDFAGIALCMHDSESDDWCAILPACKTRKMHTSRRDAFKPINDTVIARVNAFTGEIVYVKPDYPRASKIPLEIKSDFEEKVALVKTHPNFHAEQLEP